MGYVPPPFPGEPDPYEPWLKAQIIMWLVSMPLIVASVVVILYATVKP